MVAPGDLLIHLGDVGIGDKLVYTKMVGNWPGRKVLVRGNHDGPSCQWWMEHGFDFACDAMVYRSVWLTHKPWLGELPSGTRVNVHGHLHNVWDGFLPENPEKCQEEFTFAAKSGKLLRDFHLLFAVEYTNYCPVEFDKFVGKPDKYQARHPNKPIAPPSKNPVTVTRSEICGTALLEEQRRRQAVINARLDGVTMEIGYVPSVPDATGDDRHLRNEDPT